MSNERGVGIHALSDEVLVHFLSYLQAKELGVLNMVDRTVFCVKRLQMAVKTIMRTSLVIPLTSPLKRQQSLACCLHTPSSLFVFEVCNILAALSTPIPLTEHKAYWISTSWCVQAKRYYENLELPLLTPVETFDHNRGGYRTPNSPNAGKKQPSKKKLTLFSKPQSNYYKDSVPSLDMNQDIVCEHGQLALIGTPGCKRRLINKKSWAVLRRSNGVGREFKCIETTECATCLKGHQNAKTKLEEQRETTLSLRRQTYMPNSLAAFVARKSGVPIECTIAKWLSLSEQEMEDEQLFHQAIQSLGLNSNRPLVPGMYNLVPRYWARVYRRYLRDPEIAAIPSLDCTRMLCYAHGLVVVPPHVEEYLIGLRHSLLNNLLEYPGEIVEIVTLEEWEAIQRLSRTDFHVRFCLDGDEISWNVGICRACDPFNYGTSNGAAVDRKCRTRVTVL